MAEVGKSAKKALYVVKIKEEWCKGPDCGICIYICPKKVLEMKGITAAVKDIDSCTGCLLCEIECPDFAIRVFEENKD